MTDGALSNHAGADILLGDPRYSETVHFLYREAALLDDGQLEEWLDLLTDDVSYQLPVRRTLNGGVADAFSASSNIMSENLASLRVRVHKLTTEYAWAESPRSRSRHHITNVRVRETARDDEIRVISNVLVYRTRGNEPAPDIFSAERRDLLRETDSGWRLAQRLVLLDQTIVTARHLAILL